MALQSTRKISLIKIIVSQQASQSFTNRTVATSSSNCRTRRSILFTNSSTNTDRSQSIFRLACTTSKKSTAFTHNVPEHTFADLPSGKQLDLTFSDSKTAFKSKTNFELLRGYLVFELCGVKFLLDNQQKLLNASRAILGKDIFNKLMKNTFYGHFVAGENSDEIRPNVEKMRRYGVKSILDYSAEEDLEAEKVGNCSKQKETQKPLNPNRRLYEASEAQYEKNLEIFLNCLDTVESVTEGTGLAAIKVTSLIRPALLLKFSSLVDYVESRKIEKDLFNIKTVLGMSDTELADVFNSVSEVTYSAAEAGEIKNMFSRLDDLANKALSKKVRMFVDAEQTYFQGAIRRVTVELMRQYNKDQCTVMNTYQNYLKNAYKNLVEDMKHANREGYKFGAKLVRGAYMEQERERAAKLGYEDPVNESYKNTTQMYERSFICCLEAIKENPGKVNIMVASHNEDTIRFAVKKMEEYGVRPNDDAVFFGQLYGMCDFITFYLGSNGYSAFKYVPYGPVDEVLPYLSRRATENGKGVFEKVQKEKNLVKEELFRRLKHLEFV